MAYGCGLGRKSGLTGEEGRGKIGWGVSVVAMEDMFEVAGETAGNVVPVLELALVGVVAVVVKWFLELVTHDIIVSQVFAFFSLCSSVVVAKQF